MKFYRKAMAALLAATMVVGTGVSASAANNYNFAAPMEPISVDDNIITASVHRAGSVLPEVLGLNTKCGFSLINGTMPDTLEDAQTKLMLGAFGTYANEVPNPYYYNYFYNFRAKAEGKAISEDALLCPVLNVQASPVGADTNIVDGYGTSISLAGRPDVLIGCSSGNQGADVNGYDALIADIRNGVIGEEYYQEGDENYAPYLVSYTTTTTYDMVVTLNEVANVMNQITEETGKVGRYGDPTAIAKSFGDYVCGIPAYILAELDNKGLEKKRVAIVQSINDDGTFTIADAASKSATSNNRLVEYVALITDNIAADYGITVSKEQLLTADAYILPVMGSTISRSEFQEAVGEDLSDKVIVAEIPDTIYGITMNSIENGMGFGYFGGYIYSDILDISPVEMCAYFYEQFYHVTDQASLQSITSNTMSNVVLPQDMSSTLKDYNTSDIAAKIAEGVEYYYNHISQFENTALTKVLGTSRGDSIQSGLSQVYDTANDEKYAPAEPEDPSVEDPSTENPSAEDPSTENPSAEDPSTENPSAEDPSTENPSVEDPSTENPSAEDPSTENPSVEEPGTEVPDTEDPGIAGPVDNGNNDGTNNGSGTNNGTVAGNNNGTSTGNNNGTNNTTNNGTTTGTNTTTGTTVKTGDANNAALWLLMVCIAGAGVVTVTYCEKKRRENM